MFMNLCMLLGFGLVAEPAHNSHTVTATMSTRLTKRYETFFPFIFLSDFSFLLACRFVIAGFFLFFFYFIFFRPAIFRNDYCDKLEGCNYVSIYYQLDIISLDESPFSSFLKRDAEVLVGTTVGGLC